VKIKGFWKIPITILAVILEFICCLTIIYPFVCNADTGEPFGYIYRYLTKNFYTEVRIISENDKYYVIQIKPILTWRDYTFYGDRRHSKECNKAVTLYETADKDVNLKFYTNRSIKVVTIPEHTKLGKAVRGVND
jgi:hypothetical protein